MLRVLSVYWRCDISPEEKARIQSSNSDQSNPLDCSGFEYLIQVGFPPVVGIVRTDDANFRKLKAAVEGLPTDIVQANAAISAALLEANQCRPQTPTPGVLDETI